MQILVIHMCADMFSYDSYHRAGCWIEGDYSKQDLEAYKKQYVDAFNKKRMSKISVVHVDIAEDGVVTVLENIHGQHPLKERIEINPAAVAKKAARSKPTNTTTATAPSFFTMLDEVSAA